MSEQEVRSQVEIDLERLAKAVGSLKVIFAAVLGLMGWALMITINQQNSVSKYDFMQYQLEQSKKEYARVEWEKASMKTDEAIASAVASVAKEK